MMDLSFHLQSGNIVIAQGLGYLGGKPDMLDLTWDFIYLMRTRHSYIATNIHC